ncbi:c-type cytochrome [Glacieibacterium sp.]|uniref:c-type cytochrome n=1 Tax=Glacieibacterium sp. TaxID=2860237 RepID=UPI003AFFB1D8
MIAALAVLGFSVNGYAQSPAQSVWNGAFTAEQAQRGKASYTQACAVCHGPSLGGGDSAPPLSGGVFLNNWNGTTTGSLFERIHDTMPASDPGSLSGKTVADIEAYILQTNGFPAGAVPLPADQQLMTVTKILATKPAG